MGVPCEYQAGHSRTHSMKTSIAPAGVLLGVLIFACPACDHKVPVSAGRPARAEPASGGPDQEPKPSVASKGRIFVAVTTAPGSALEGEEKDPYRGTTILAVDPDTGASERIVEKAAEPRLSADGKTMVYVTAKGIAVGMGNGPSRFIKDVDPEKTWPLLSADGKEIIYDIESPQAKDGRRSFDSWRCGAADGGRTKLPIPDADRVIDWSPDGQWLLTLRWGRRGGAVQLHIMRPDGTGEWRLSDGSGVISIARFSPDGKRLVYMHQEGIKNALW